MIPTYYEFQNSTKIISGNRALENIPFELRNLKAERPMVLTDKFLNKIGIVNHVLDALKDSDVVIGDLYDDIPPDSGIKVINEIAKVYREQQCDSIIAVGGGSVIDTAKGVNILITEECDDLKEFMGLENLTGRQQPFIAVPTTSGTGSEATLVAVIADHEKKVKMEFLSYNMLPDVSVLDPRMTKTLPPKLTASTGFDAMVHAIEAYTSVQKNPISDAFAISAINLIREYLPIAIEDGKNEEARLALANASNMAGAAFSNSMVGIIHAIGHACGGISHVPHGDAVAILLPYGMEFNLEKVSDYYGELLLHLGGAEIYAKTPKSNRGGKAIEVVKDMSKKLNEQCGLPIRLRDAGVKKEDLLKIASIALDDGACLYNPIEVTIEDIIGILEKAY